MPGRAASDLVLVCHRNLARLAQHSPLGDHAFGDFRHVRDEVGAKLHRIACASVAGFLAGLSMDAARSHCVNADQQSNGQQYRSACETHDTQHYFFPCFRTGKGPERL
jgi:hypothetical protein